MRNLRNIFNLVYIVPVFIFALSADRSVAGENIEFALTKLSSWQQRHLLEPSPRDRLREKQGRIVIYDGLLDTVVESALDLYFDRIENMMFTRIVVTSKDGKPLLDPDTGELVIEDDGC